MAAKLGIFVTSDRHLQHVVGLAGAAHRVHKEVIIFFTHKGVALTQDPRFKELIGKAQLSVCNVKFEEYGFVKDVVGVGEKDYGTQARHGTLLDECDRYLVF
jgi:predicted peroxiredoxin